MRAIILWALCCWGLPLAAQKANRSGELRVILPDVQFGAEQATLSKSSMLALDEVVTLAKKYSWTTLEVGAHTDASGSASYNLRLSQRRAQSVTAYLAKKGLSQKRLKARGYGETDPLNRCRRGVRCSEAENRENRRIELRVQGLPDEAAARAEWQSLSGIPVSATATATAPAPATAPATAPAPATATAPAPATVPAGNSDYFPELSDNQAYVPQPLPATFIGYTVEFGCFDKPLGAGHPLLRKYETIFLRQEKGTGYCYYIGAFHTLTSAQDFLRTQALPKYPKARITVFANDEKKYISH